MMMSESVRDPVYAVMSEQLMREELSSMKWITLNAIDALLSITNTPSMPSSSSNNESESEPLEMS